ncbi:MAG: tRNA-intron lyase [Candidatus Woesearchaeota archaeon]|nr:MAG: tRNA-intron lyase [Candidatus Woesearchaeota archaeon]
MEEQKIEAKFFEGHVSTSKSDQALVLYDQSRYGELVGGKIKYSLFEALYLLEKEKLDVKLGKKSLDFDSFVSKSSKKDKGFLVKYIVFRDMRNRGYIIKTALKFGADFRVYDRGVKPGEDHAKWVLYPIHESKVLTWHDFSAKNRVAHSTRKRLLIAVVDDEEDVSYWECAWKRP